MQRKLLGTINVDFNVNRSTIDHIICIRQRLEEKMGIQQSCESAIYRLQENSVRREVLYNILIEFGIPMKLVRLKKNVYE